MKTHRFRIKSLLFLSAAILIAVFVVGAMAIRGTLREQQQKPDDKRVTKLPLIISRVKNLEVISATLEKPGEPNAEVVLEIQNNSDLAVLAVMIESADDVNSSAISTHGDLDSDTPLVVIEPHKSLTMRMPAVNLILGVPLRVAGAIYADGSESGDKSALETMRTVREHDKAERARRRETKTP